MPEWNEGNLVLVQALRAELPWMLAVALAVALVHYSAPWVRGWAGSAMVVSETAPAGSMVEFEPREGWDVFLARRNSVEFDVREGMTLGQLWTTHILPQDESFEGELRKLLGIQNGELTGSLKFQADTTLVFLLTPRSQLSR